MLSLSGGNISMRVLLIAPTICGILQRIYSTKGVVAVTCSNVVKWNLINSDDRLTSSHVASWTIFTSVNFAIPNTSLIVRLWFLVEKRHNATANRFSSNCFSHLCVHLFYACATHVQANHVGILNIYSKVWGLILNSRFPWIKPHCSLPKYFQTRISCILWCSNDTLCTEYLPITTTGSLFVHET